MVQEFQTSKGEFISLKLHKEASNIHIGSFYKNKISYRTTNSLHFIEENLPDGDWEMIGVSKFLTEDQAKLIVEEGSALDHAGYFSYQGHEGDYITAFKAFESIIKQLKCYSENPWGLYPPLKYEFCDGIDFDYRAYQACTKRWNDAEDRVGQWVIFKKIMK